MALVFNTTNEEQTVQALGNWFTLKPKQIKWFNENLAAFLCVQRSENGLVALGEAFEDPSYKNSPEGKVEYLAAERSGITNYLRKQKEIVDNNIRSLGRDLQTANITADPRSFMSEGEMHALEILAKYRDLEQDEANKKVERAQELERKLGLDK